MYDLRADFDEKTAETIKNFWGIDDDELNYEV